MEIRKSIHTKFLLISMIITSLTSADIHRHNCTKYHNGTFKICRVFNTLTFVNQTGKARHLVLNLVNISSIMPMTFQRGMTIDSLELSFIRRYPHPAVCPPKFIKLSPTSFFGLTNIHHLSLNCIKFSMTSNPFKNFNSLRSLKLKTIPKFPNKFFGDFPHLKKLQLMNIKMTKISGKFFSKVNRELEELVITDKIEFVKPRSFKRFYNLRVLKLQDCQLRVMRSEMFEGLDKLEYLSFGFNGMSILPPGIFRKLQKLQSLCLPYNGLSEIEYNIFRGLKLRKLSLFANHFTSIPEEISNVCGHLEYLDLSFNKMETLYRSVIHNCSKLRSLKLNNNKIHDIDSGALDGLRLETLDLTYNSLKEVENWFFFGFDVKSLDLRGNNISKISPYGFLNLTAEEVLFCYHNYATKEETVQWVKKSSIHKLVIDDCEF